MTFPQRLKQAITWPLVFLFLMWAVFLLQNTIGGADWYTYGIAPRKTFAWRGIFLTPFLHGGWGHIISNSVPFFALMAMILFFYPRVAVAVLLVIYLGTGVTMWAFADPEALFSPYNRVNFHIGASGVVYGMASFLAFTGFFRRNIRAIAISLVIIFYYGGMIWGVLPNQEGVSWEGHLLGAVVGIFAAYWFRQRIEQAEVRKKHAYELEEEEERYFLPRDTFKG
ncbi:MAG: rhomboid family intramembrane serine protease [Bacteroidota bacterium]